jgi:hypothetical protein
MSHYKSHQPSIYLLMAGILSLGYEKFDKKKKQTEAGSAQPEPDVRLARLGESFTLDGVSWQSNDESKSYRQMRNGTAAFFHFRHWDDFCSTGFVDCWVCVMSVVCRCFALIESC